MNFSDLDSSGNHLYHDVQKGPGLNEEKSLHRLVKEMGPEHDLWPHIQANLKKSFWLEYKMYFAAAALILFFIVPSVFYYYLGIQTEKMKRSYYYSSSIVQMETEYTAAKDEIISQLSSNMTGPELMKEVKKQIVIIEKHQKEIKELYASHPDNMDVLRCLNRSYRQGIQFLQYISKFKS